MGSLPNLHELCKQQQQQQQPVCVPAAPRLSPCPDRGGGSGTSRAQHRRLQQTNSLCTNNFYGVIDRQADMQIDEKPFSPTSLRSTLSTTHRQVSVANASSASGKRRDSLSSSAGASSVRRLIEVVRTTPSNMGPVYSRRLLCRNYVTLCLGHGAAAAALVPFMALQGSISAWWWPDNLKQNGGFTTVTTDIGSILLSAMFGMAAMSALFGPTAVHRLGTRTCLVAGYLVSVAFVTVHLYPKVAVLVPGYFLMGAWLGCWTASRTAVLMALASKMAYVLSDREECELEGNGRREAVARNLARGLQKPFSPTSLRSTLSTTHRQVSVANASSASGKRRDSLSSSAGASSVRRLIEVVRTTPSNMGPVYSRRLLCRNYVTLCLGHGAAAAALVPFMALQGSISAWWWPDNLKQNGGFTTVTTDIGSILLSAMFGMAAMSALFGPTAVHRLGTRTCLVAGYLVSVAFVTVHLYPKVAVLVPGYFLMGAWLGCWTASRTAVLMALASKMAYVLSDREECELEGNGRREAVARNLARGLQVAHDIGLIAGNAFVAYMISGTRTDDILGTMFARAGGPGTDRTCGSVACPLENTVEIKLGPTANFSSNQTVALVDVRNHMVLPCKTTQLLASVFAGCCFVGVAVTATFMTRIRLFVYASASEKRKSDSARSFAAVRDAFRNTKLQLIAPLSLFIGLEQGFIYSDFSKFYVVCSVGVSNVPTVLLSLGLLQLVAGFTVSLILQHIRRYHIIVIGLAFHSCLLMVLMKWKPSGDDAALLYVIAAAWGVCNAIWNTLCFNFVISLYPDYWHGPMAHGYFFRYSGMALAFGLHSVVCNTTKLYCLSAALVVAVVLYGWLEWRLQLTGKRRRTANRSS